MYKTPAAAADSLYGVQKIIIITIGFCACAFSVHRYNFIPATSE